MNLRLLVALGLTLSSCRAPAPAPTVAPVDARGCGDSLLAATASALDENLESAFPCDPRPGAAGWVRGDPQAFAPTPGTPEAAPRPPLDVRQPRFALVLDGRGVASLDGTLATLRGEADYRVLVASPSPPRRADERQPPTAAGVDALIASLRRQLAPGAVLVVVVAEVLDAPDEPWGCAPLADTCLPLSRLRHELEDLRTGARVVVLEQAAPRLAIHALADAAAVVITLPEGQVGKSAARAFWSARVPDGDRDGVIAVRERAEHARRIAPGARFVDPLGHLSFGRKPARAGGQAPLEVYRRDELNQAIAALRPDEIAVVNLSTTWCEACKPFRVLFDELARRTGGPLRFIHAETDERWDGFPVLSYPAVAFIAPGGRILGLAADPRDPLASLHVTQFEAIEDQIAHLRVELRSRFPRHRALAARTIAALGPPGAALIDDLARALHEETDAGVIFDVLLALGGHGEKARHSAPELVALLHHKNDQVRAYAVHTLGLIDAELRPIACPLVSLVADPSERVRVNAVELLAAHPDVVPPLLPALRVIMEDAQPAVRMAALTAFRGLPWGEAAAGALPTLLRLATPGEPPDQRIAAMMAIVDLERRAAPAVPDLAQLLVDPEPAVRRQAALALGHCGGAARCAADALAALGDDPDPHTRRKASEALARIDGGRPR